MIRFVLAEEDAEDMEEVAEALTDFEGMNGTTYACEILVSQETISVPPLPGRLVYLRRECP
ncbi:hypothetical protein ABI_42360 [Asticcacaulis biprosthecium C19]|uniref:Uncharacterized protein n=2 Tax=Asticcacaulis biprosthecium TaxID=76891 RepID=F4QSU3_9CAUL|nr:hypothetical protein ABI_42360 [Asticcacaulis biprosthecium C19]